MKIILINHSDSRGGASVVTRRLMHALRDAGHDARMLVVHKATEDEYVTVFKPAWRSKLSFVQESLSIALGNGFDRSTLFKLSVASAGLPLYRHPLVNDADIIMLNWVNQGMLSYNGIHRICKLGKPVIWTMHDMWNLVGACHHAGNCDRYSRQCGNCPLLGSHGAMNDMTHKSWLGKNTLYSDTNIHFVAVSNWLADKAAESSLLRDRNVTVIPNAFPLDRYARDAAYTRKELGLPDGPIIAMGAARLDDPIKDLPKAIEAFNILADDGCKATAVLFGAIRDHSLLDKIRLPFVYLGTVNDPERLHSLYKHSSAVISSSSYETLPGTLIEGQACGALPVSFGQGGQPDIIDHKRTGYIARYGDTEDLANGLRWALRPVTPENCSDDRQIRDNAIRSVAEKFDAPIVAERYMTLCNQLLTAN